MSYDEDAEKGLLDFERVVGEEERGFESVCYEEKKGEGVEEVEEVVSPLTPSVMFEGVGKHGMDHGVKNELLR